MNIENSIASALGMSDETWAKHTNPLSVWTRFPLLLIFSICIWSRVWLGWYCLVPLIVFIIWAVINPRFFTKPKSTKNWASKSVIGEKIWTNRKDIEVPKRHHLMVTILTVLQSLGTIVTGIGLYQLNFWETATGIVMVYLAKMWFLDRMVWICEDMQMHEKYRNLLY